MMYEDLKYDMEEELFYSKEDFLTPKAKKGNADAMYLLGVLYFEGDQPEEAYSWFTKAAKKGQPDATYYLGNFYGHPKGFDVVEPSEQTMIEYWSKAVELGSVLAMCELGRRYRQGRGVEKNEAKAIELFEESKLYIKNLQEQKRDFLSNYAPDEVKKLNSAEVRRFGNYIIFTISDPDDKNYVFSKAEEILKK